VSVSAASHSTRPDATVPKDGLVHIAIVYDHVSSARNKIYLDGQEVELWKKYPSSNVKNTQLPQARSVQLWFQKTLGLIVHSMALFDRELSSTEIGNLIAAGVPPSLPVFPNTLVLDETEDTDVLINPASLIAQSSDPNGSLHGIEIISKRANDSSPAGVVTLPAMSESFTLVPEEGVSTYEPPTDVCGVTADSEYVVFEISTVPMGCDDGDTNLCRIPTKLSICLKSFDDPGPTTSSPSQSPTATLPPTFSSPSQAPTQRGATTDPSPNVNANAVSTAVTVLVVLGGILGLVAVCGAVAALVIWQRRSNGSLRSNSNGSVNDLVVAGVALDDQHSMVGPPEVGFVKAKTNSL
jgi:hypothetical protein